MIIWYLVGVCKTTHARHDAEHVVVSGIHADLGSVGTFNGCVGKDKLQSCVVNSGEVACARWLVLLWAQGEGIHVNTSVGVTSVVLVWLHKIEVRALTLREAILAVQLKLGGHNRVLTPAVHVQSGLSHHECASVRDTRVGDCRSCVTEAAVQVSSSGELRGFCAGTPPGPWSGVAAATLSIEIPGFDDTVVAALRSDMRDGSRTRRKSHQQHRDLRRDRTG